MTNLLARLRLSLRKFASGESASAAAETAIWATVIILPMLSAADVAFYTYRKMQVEMAAQAAAAAAWTTCDIAAKQPALVSGKCSGVVTAMTTAAQSTSLGAAVTLQSGYPKEGYYCVSGGNALVLKGSEIVFNDSSLSTPNCGTGTDAMTPGDYIRVRVQYTFTPVFSGIPITALLPATIVKEAWMRMN
jgi:hypothetical protein